MAVITTPDYISVSRSFTNARTLIDGTTGEMIDAVELIVLSNDLETEIDLLMPFWNAYQTAIVDAQTPTYLRTAVGSLQRHVMTRATDPSTGVAYIDINDWMRDESITVPATFAGISELAGWVIDHDRISADPTISIAY